MKRTFFFVFALAALPLLAADKVRPVVVDPLDLRKPVPDPGGPLTEKYDGKVVRFTGTVSRATLDKATKQPRFEMQYAILEKPAGAKKAKVAETIVVAVSFANSERNLPVVNTARPGTVTVEGQGAVMTDGSLVITEASIVLEKKPAAGR